MKLRKIFPHIIAIAITTLNVLPIQANALEVSDLYQAKVLVDKSPNGKSNATKKALKQVLVKLAGKDFVNSNEQIRKQLAKPNKFLSQFSYTQEQQQTFLTASFESDKVNTLLQQANAHIWGKHRPLMTVWMVDEDGANRTVIDDSNLSDDKTTLLKAASERGLPVNFPLMDLTDAMTLTVSDVWGRFSQNLNLASERYLAEAVLVIRVSNSTLIQTKKTNCGDQCQSSEVVVDWHIVLNGETLQNTITGSDKQQTITRAVNDLADVLHEKNSYQFNDQQHDHLDIEITQVKSVQSFSKISALLENLSSVSKVKLISVNGQNILFRLTILADENAIKQALKLEGDLVENFDIIMAEENAPSMSFNWKG